MTLHTYLPKHPHQCPYQISNFYTLQLLRYSPGKFLKIKVTIARSKVKSRSHHDVAHLHPLPNVPTTYQLSTPYGYCDIAQTRFYRSTSLLSKVKSRSHHDVAHQFLSYSLDKLFLLAHPDTMGEKNTRTKLG